MIAEAKQTTISKDKKPKMIAKYPKPIGILLLIFFASIILTYLLFLTYYQQGFFPGVKVAGQRLNQETPSSIYSKLNADFQNRTQIPLSFTGEGRTFNIDLAKAQPSLDLAPIINQAYAFGRSQSPIINFKQHLQAVVSEQNFALTLNYQKQDELLSQIERINWQVKKDPTDAQIVLGTPLTIIAASEGEEVDSQVLLKRINDYLTLTSSAPTSLPTKSTPPKFTTAQAERYKEALETLTDSPLILRYENQILNLNQQSLFNLLDFSGSSTAAPGDKSSYNITEEAVRLDKKRLTNFLTGVAQKINRPSFDAKFTFNPQTKKVSEFQAAQEGRELDLEQTAALIIQALNPNSKKEILLPVKVTPPKILTGDVNTFGINELLARGVSYFTGSIDNRIYNIKLAASRINGTLIPQNEVFSFNKVLGDVSAETGYKPAYVIKSGRTVLDDGGGVCQVSTTVFRSVLNAGLPINERTAHAYRVGYYEQGGFAPGLDATVFYPSVDFKFKNNTPAYILLQAYVQGTTLYVDLYGTSDGRQAALTTPQILNQTPPPPELRQDDPSLPKGVVKQVDWPAWGANVSFKRTVKRGEETLISETWRSNYRPWQAVYLVGTRE